MSREQIIKDKLEEIGKQYDEQERLLSTYNKNWVGGYHTRRTGVVHGIKDSAEYAASILLLKQETLYPRAFGVLSRVCELQDQKKESKTFGLWSYYREEDLEHMSAPDYNWSDFVSKNLIGVMICCNDIIPERLKQQLKNAIENAMVCSIKRNVGPDYTNISLMSSMTIISAGELLGNELFLEHGKRRLEKLYDYTVFNSSFTEYNSSAYILVAICEIMRMLMFFKDERCVEIAGKLNEYAWECLTSHYNVALEQLTPPQVRAYRDLENGSLAWCIYQGTNGQYGYIPSLEGISMESLVFPPICPKPCMDNLETKESWIAHTYYKKNTLRNEGEDNTIIREVDGPDLTAYSYKTDKYSMGVFKVCDTWNQRRNSMVIWGKNKPCYFRLRSIEGDYDFSSGMVYADQYKNAMLGHVGLVTDRGSFHYILDKVKNGTYETKRLYFKFELGGDSENVTIKRNGSEFIISYETIDIKLTIHQWIYDGKEGEIRFNKKDKSIELVCFDSEESVHLDTNSLKQTYGVYSLCVENVVIENVETKVQGNKVISKGKFGERMLSVQSPILPITFQNASIMGAEKI